MRRAVFSGTAALVAAGAIVMTLGLMGTTAALAAPRAPLAATIRLNPNSGPGGTTTTVTGKGFQANEQVKITYHDPKGMQKIGKATADSTGAFSVQVNIPMHATPGPETVQGRGLTSNRVAKGTFTVT